MKSKRKDSSIDGLFEDNLLYVSTKTLFDLDRTFKIRDVSNSALDYYYLNSGFRRTFRYPHDINIGIPLLITNKKKAFLTRIKLGF